MSRQQQKEEEMQQQQQQQQKRLNLLHGFLPLCGPGRLMVLAHTLTHVKGMEENVKLKGHCTDDGKREKEMKLTGRP